MISALALLLGYLFGSIPFGLLLTRFFGAGDIRSIGSGNIGATNVLRTGRKDLAAATLLLDAFKGFAAVIFVGTLFGPKAAGLAGFGAFAGHLYPVWLKFKGGKGVATYLGIALAMAPWAALAFAIVWLLTAKITKYSSLSALVATIVTPIAAFLYGSLPAAILLWVLTLIIFWSHRENIKRLMAGTESKIGAKSG